MRLAFVLCALILPFFAVSQEWLTLYQKAQTSFGDNQFETAYQEATETLKKYQAESGETNDSYASILRLLANVCFQQNKLQEGLEFAQKEIQIREGKKDLVLSTAYENAAQFHRSLGSYEKALEQLVRSKEILLNFYSVEESQIVDCHLEMAINYYLANDSQKAYALFSDSFKKLKEETPETLLAYYYFGLLNLEMGNVDNALSIFLDTKNKYETNQLTGGPDYPLILKGYAEALHRLRQFEKAEIYYQESQSLFEKLQMINDEDYLHLLNGRAINLELLGKDDQAESLFAIVANHPNGNLAYATALNNRAAMKQSKGDYDKSQALYEQALSKLNKTKPEEVLVYAETLQNFALLLIEKKQTEKAIEAIEESHKIVEQSLGDKHHRAINSLNKKASIYFKARQLAKAKTDYQKSLAIQFSIGAAITSETAIALTGLAQCYQKEKNFARSDSVYQLVLSHYQSGRLNRDDQFVSTLVNYASTLQDQGKWREAISLVSQASDQVKKSKGSGSENFALLMSDLSMLNLKMGFRERAKQELDSAELYYDSGKKKSTEPYGLLLLNKGRYFQVIGDYQQAEQNLRKGAELLEKVSGDASELYAYGINSLALYYQTMGNFGEAEPLLKKALAIRETTNGKVNSEYATVLQNLAALYQLQENYAKAEPLLQEANKIDQEILGTNHPQYLVSLQNLATLYQKKKELDKAAFMMETVRSLTEKTLGKSHPSYATVISNLASLYQDQGKYAQAESFWQESVNLRQSLLGEDHPDYARSLYGLAGVYFATGKLEQAGPYFSKVVEKYEKQIVNYFGAMSEKEKGAFYNRIQPVFESFQDFCVQRLAKQSGEGIAERLYDLQLSTKAILLNASNKVRNAIMTSGDVELQKMFQHWQQTKEELVRYYSFTTEERARLKIDLAKVEEQANDLEKKLSERSAQFGNIGKKIITWKDVQASLKPNETAIEIIRVKKKFVTDSVYYAALVLNSESTKPKLLIWPEGSKLETRWYRYLRNMIKFQQHDTLSFKHIWAPLLRELPTSQTLYISCDGVFNKINLNCIQNPANGRYTLDEYNIRLVSNTRELTEAHPSMKNPSAQASIFGYADFNLPGSNLASVAVTSGGKRASRFGFQGEEIPMLPATKKEVTLLNDLLSTKSWKIDAFMLQDASEENLKKVNNPQVLHIATHGFFLNDVDLSDELESNEESQLVKNPLFRSGILLAGAGVQQNSSPEDGVLTAYEAMNLALDNTELVALSACETGLGEVRNGEGVYGLQRSFLVAGARTVIMSLWQVDDDATQELMSSFYTKWISGVDKFQAFRAAQLEIKEKYTLPFYWGAFVLIGN